MKLCRGAMAYLAVGLLTTAVSAQMRMTESTAPAYGKYVAKAGAGEKVLWVPHTPYDLDTEQFDLADGSYICVFATGAPGVIVLDAWRNGPENEAPIFVRLVLKVGGPGPDPGPGPNPGPDPQPLSDWAKLAHDNKSLINQRSRGLAATVGDNFQATAAAIAAGVITSKDAAIADLHARNQRAWGTGGEADWRDWLYKIGREVDRSEDAGKLNDIKLYGLVLRDIGTGLKHGE